MAVGTSVGVGDGTTVGALVGVSVGVLVGTGVGVLVGDGVDVCVGVSVGVCVAVGTGSSNGVTSARRPLPVNFTAGFGSLSTPLSVTTATAGAGPAGSGPAGVVSFDVHAATRTAVNTIAATASQKLTSGRYRINSCPDFPANRFLQACARARRLAKTWS